MEKSAEDDDTKLLLNEIENFTKTIGTAVEDAKKKIPPEIKGFVNHISC